MQAAGFCLAFKRRRHGNFHEILSQIRPGEFTKFTNSERVSHRNVGSQAGAARSDRHHSSGGVRTASQARIFSNMRTSSGRDLAPILCMML